jgi:hypothetical protein
MAYTIDRFNKTPLTTVEDGTLNEVTDIKFVGKNYAGYGEVHNENFLHMMEHFAGANQPPKPVSGQIWYDTGSDRMKFRDENSSWRTIGGAEVSGVQPAGLAEGDFWWDSANEQLHVYNGSTFILIGPQDAGEGITQMVSQTVLTTQSQTKSIIVAFINDIPQYVISNEEFTVQAVEGNHIDALNPTAFTVIKPGITLREADTTTGESTSKFWGTAANADKLGGIAATEFTQKADASFTERIQLSTQGLVIDEDFSIYKDANTEHAIIANESIPLSEIHFITLDSSSNPVHSVTINSGGIKPGLTTNDYNIGTAEESFHQVYATSFKGTADQANKLRVGLTGSSYTYASEDPTASTIAVRDSNNTISAEIFNGTATQARFADLAEKYTTAENWPVGTVMHICEHPDHEACPCMLDSHPVGVVSANPAYLMNMNIKGQALALEGRVPVRIIGDVKKGDKVYVDSEGCASTRINGNPLVGIALESNPAEEEKLVECILRL